MNNKFDEATRGLVDSVSHLKALNKFCTGLAGIALACFGSLNLGQAQTSLITDPAGDAVWPFVLYDGPVPQYLDIVQVSVTLRTGVFHFEVQMAADIPSVPDPGLSPSVNHLGATVGILTDRRTAGQFKIFGQTDVYHFNFLVGALYSFEDSGIGLPLGWSGFFIDVATFTAVPMRAQIKGDTLIFDISATALGSPGSFQWAVVTECDPVPVTSEKKRSLLLEDYAPDHDYANWPSLGP